MVALPAPEDIAVRLNLDEGAKVWSRRRITTVDDEPVMTCDSYYPADLVADTPITQPGPILGMDWSILEGDLGRRVAYAIEDLHFRPATPEERERLRARPDAGIVHLLSTVYDTDGQPFKVNDFRLLADRHLLSYRIEAAQLGQ
ncbi:MAG: GntR family transcriptional regulator [Egibacteraceae bacterium]